MADITITASLVTAPATSVLTAVEAITAGQALYKTSGGQLGVATNADSAKDDVHGLAACNSAAGQPVVFMESGKTANFGAAILAVSETYVLSVDGKFAPIGDIDSSDWVTRIGHATTTSTMLLDIKTQSLQAP